MKKGSFVVEFIKKNFQQYTGCNDYKKKKQLLCKRIGEGSFNPSSGKRGKYPNKTMISNVSYQQIKLHIKYLPKYTSHCSRKKNSKKVNINHYFCRSSLHRSYWNVVLRQKYFTGIQYQRVFSNLNITLDLNSRKVTCKIWISFLIELTKKIKQLKCN